MGVNGEVYEFFTNGYVNANEFKGFKSVAEAYELNIISKKGELFFDSKAGDQTIGKTIMEIKNSDILLMSEKL